MAVVSPPAWIQAGSYTAHTDRLVTASIVQDEGVAQDGDLAVTASSTPGMSVKVAAGRAWIRDASPGAIENKGMYNFVNDGDVTLSVTASHATLGRIDRVVARVEDADVSGSNNVASLQVIAGTPSSSPVAPALPASSLSLKTISVAANATTVTNANLSGSVSQAKIHSGMVDPVTVVTSSTRPTGSSRTLGMMIFETDTGRDWRWNGSEWQFRGGRGPRAFVSRGGAWIMSTSASYLTTLDPATGSNFETAYFTFYNSGDPEVGDQVRVKQSGMYSVELFVNMSNYNVDYFADVRTEVVTGSTGLPSDAVTFPRVSGQFTKGRSMTHDSRVLYLPTGCELAWRYDAGDTNIQVAEFWASITLIG